MDWKRRGWRFLGLGLVLGQYTWVGAGGGDVDDPRRDAAVEAVEAALPSVVNIATEEVVPTTDAVDRFFREFFDPYYRRRAPDTQYSLGSGVIVDEEGYIVTNYHVVARARRVWVRLMDGREFEAEKVGETAPSDVALLKIRGNVGETFSAIRFAGDDDLLLGETVLALGNPFGLGGSVSRGILSSKSRRPPREDEALDVLDWLQTDAAINPGNSGGPMINMKGELIGLSVAVYREGQGIGFAIPVKRVVEALGTIYSPERMEQLWFGARMRPGTHPLEVAEVEEGSPADQAGLEAGDRVVQVNGETCGGFFEFQRQLLREGEARSIRLEVVRGGTNRVLLVRLIEEAKVFNAEMVREKTGASVQELTLDLARALGLGPVRGLLVAGVEPESAAARVGLGQGMVITRLDGRPVARVMTMARRLRQLKSGQSVRLDVVVPRQRGPFYMLEEAAVELRLP